MQRALEAFLLEWQRDRAEEDRVVAEITAILATAAKSRQAMLEDLEAAVTRRAIRDPNLTQDDISMAIRRVREQNGMRMN